MERILKLIVALQLHLTKDTDSDRGATATEYALLVALIALVIVGGVTVFGNQLDSFFSGIGAQLGNTF